MDVPLHQRTLSNAIDDASYQHLFNSTSTIRSRVSCSLPHAGDWLNVVPSPSLGLHLHNSFIAVSATGLEFQFTAHLTDVPNVEIDVFGDHQVGCGGNGDRITRHNAVRDVLYSAAQAAALGPIKEASNARPADILLPTWSHSRLLPWMYI